MAPQTRKQAGESSLYRFRLRGWFRVRFRAVLPWDADLLGGETSLHCTREARYAVGGLLQLGFQDSGG
jgi:hypothetical protein